MINQPDTQDQKPESGKLVLPAPPAVEQQIQYGDQKLQLRPEQLIRQQTQPAPKGAGPRLAYYWRKDPAYKVLIIAMAMVFLAGIVFFSFASAAILGNRNLFSSSQNIPTGANPTGTVDLRPTFPTPGGGNGSNTSSQPPMQQTPALQPTADQSSPTPGAGTLTVQITNIPHKVPNGSRVDVGVNTSEPGVSVVLVIHYNAQPFQAFAGPQTTNSNGDATIPWFVNVFGFGQRNIQANVYALATDQNGQRARSQIYTVFILPFGTGG